MSTVLCAGGTLQTCPQPDKNKHLYGERFWGDREGGEGSEEEGEREGAR